MRQIKFAILLMLICTQPISLAGNFFKTSLPDGTVSFSDVRPGSSRRQYRPVTVEPNLSNARFSCVHAKSQAMADRISVIGPAIDRIAGKNNVNRHLIKAIVRVESCFDRKAVSRAGAQGLMQLMPGTAKQYGVSDPFDIAQNLNAGVAYFADLQDQFNSDLKLSLAAYNAGPGAVNKYDGIPPYPETQRYVGLVMEKYHEFALSGIKAGVKTP